MRISYSGRRVTVFFRVNIRGGEGGDELIGLADIPDRWIEEERDADPLCIDCWELPVVDHDFFFSGKQLVNEFLKSFCEEIDELRTKGGARLFDGAPLVPLSIRAFVTDTPGRSLCTSTRYFRRTSASREPSPQAGFEEWSFLHSCCERAED